MLGKRAVQSAHRLYARTNIHIYESSYIGCTGGLLGAESEEEGGRGRNEWWNDGWLGGGGKGEGEGQCGQQVIHNLSEGVELARANEREHANKERRKTDTSRARTRGAGGGLWGEGGGGGGGTDKYRDSISSLVSGPESTESLFSSFPRNRRTVRDSCY